MGLRRYTIILALIALAALGVRMLGFYLKPAYLSHSETVTETASNGGLALALRTAEGGVGVLTTPITPTPAAAQHLTASSAANTHTPTHTVTHTVTGTGTTSHSASASASTAVSPAAVPPCVGSDEWCSVPMPSVSLFRFPPPSDPVRWARAQRLAIAQEPVLLKKVLPHFPHHLDYLDGDVWFRQYHKLPDAFVDKVVELRQLTDSGRGESNVLALREEIEKVKREKYPFLRSERQRVVHEAKDLHALGRAPVVQLGYHGFGRGNDVGSRTLPLFGGPIIGEAIVDRSAFLSMWERHRAQITLPWIAMHSANENWGMLSTYFPNRTVDWGSCCEGSERERLLAFLDDKHTLMFLINQHSNFSHPKLLTFPRGIPLHNDGTDHLMFNSQRALARSGRKTDFLFTASSNWGPRPRISQCIAKKFKGMPDVRFTAYGDNRSGRLTPEQYYQKLGSAKFSIALPGLGYDTHRLWESMLLGTIPVLEKGIGLDKTLWRLPALLVDDFDLVTPELLRQAYVEALYRAEDFEFERLKQSFWFAFIANVSLAMDSSAMLDKFPPEAGVADFARPFESFECKGDKCGKGTKRTPLESC